MSFNGDVLTDGKQEDMMKAHEDAKVIWRRIVYREKHIESSKNEVGCYKEKVAAIRGQEDDSQSHKI